MKHFKGRTAVITGAGSGFGLELSRIAAARGHEPRAWPTCSTMRWTPPPPKSARSGAQVLAFRLDVAKAAEVEALGAATRARFGAPHLVFNNAGVGAGGLIWEHTLQDWEWVLGVNLMGVVHGVRVFTPMMLEAAAKDPAYEGHIVNTAVDGRPAERAEHGRLQRQQARGGVAQRDAVPGPGPGDRPDRAPRCCAPSSCPPASPERAQPAGRMPAAASRRGASSSARP